MAANLRIEGEIAGEIGVKRFYTYGITVYSICPECGEEVSMDADSNGYFFMYPTVGPKTDKPETLNFYHEVQDDEGYAEHEWQVPVVIRVTLEPVDQDVCPACGDSKIVKAPDGEGGQFEFPCPKCSGGGSG